MGEEEEEEEDDDDVKTPSLFSFSLFRLFLSPDVLPEKLETVGNGGAVVLAAPTLPRLGAFGGCADPTT